MGTVLVFVAGWFLGRYWDQVNTFIKNKLNKSNSSTGGVTRLNDDDQ